MPRRTSHEPPAAPSGLRAAFICRKPGPSLRKGARGGHPAARESGLRPAEGDPGLSLRSVRRRAFREYRAAGGGAAGPRSVRMPHFPALKGKQPRLHPAPGKPPHSDARPRIASPPEQSHGAGSIASGTGQSHTRPQRPPLPCTVLPDFSSGNPSFCTPRRRIEPIYFGIRNFFIIFACRKSDTL